MALTELRMFPFFTLMPNTEAEKLTEILKESQITCTTAGNSHLVFCDSIGQIHLVNRSWEVKSFRAYDISLTHAIQLRNSPLLVTIGNDEQGINPLIKVWDTSQFDEKTGPFCLRITRALAGNRPIKVSCLAVHENGQFMAVGFVDGSIALYRGDIARDRSSKQKLFRDLNNKITGLAFKISSNNIALFVSTDKAVVVYHITNKDKERKDHLDSIGCAPKCSILAESTQENYFMVARSDAIYCYTADGRGPCYAVEGEKTMLEWFRSYLIIISKTSRPGSFNNVDELNYVQEDQITVLDINNKFRVYQSSMPKIRAILHEWGSFFIIDNDYKIYNLDEKDLQSKLALLFKKKLYDIAIKIAKSQQYDSDALADIFKQYGDHLCEKGDFAGAIEQYIRTIGKVEPSYVIRKFVDSQYLENLIKYLQALHKQGQATEDHTTLLLNCFTKLNNASGKSDKLKEFILSKEGDLSYDVDVAIKVCRHGSPAEALMLAKKHGKHEWYIKIQIEDNGKFEEVLNYIDQLNFEEAEHYMKKYGHILVEHLPEESTQFLKKLCTDYKPENSKIIADTMPMKSDPEDFIHLFLNNSKKLVEFLEYLIAEGTVLSPSVYSTLLEHYLHVWSTTDGVSDKNKLSQSILDLLQNPDVCLDKSHALVVCNMHSFSEGILYLYEEQKLYQQILRYHISRNDPKSVLACCTRFGHQEPTLWVQTLWSCVRDTKQPSFDLLNEVLSVIAKEKLFSPQLVLDAVATGTAQISLGHIRSYIMNYLQQEMKKAQETSELTKNYRKDTDSLKRHLDELRNGVTRIQGSRCAACHHSLELPTIHFLCNHSFHQHCFQSYSDDETIQKCPTCQPENKNLLDLLKAREQNKDLHETFHYQLDKAHDGFSVAAEYFGRGVFNYYKILRHEPVERTKSVQPKPQPVPTLRQPQNYGPGAEARIRLRENVRNPVTVQHVSEGRMRTQEKYSVPQKTPQNPFEEYDDKMNPFMEEELEDTNPFRDEECDGNLNPFN